MKRRRSQADGSSAGKAAKASKPPAGPKRTTEQPPRQQPIKQQSNSAPGTLNYSSLGPKDILRALQCEADGLMKLHSMLRLQMQKLEVEEAVLQQMIRRERRQLHQQRVAAPNHAAAQPASTAKVDAAGTARANGSVTRRSKRF